MTHAILELKLLLRNKGFIAQLITYTAIALIAMWIGNQNYSNQLQAINTQSELYQHELDIWKNKPDADPGSIGYYLYAPVAKIPSPWSILFRGENQEQMDLYRIRLLALQGQIHAQPLNNAEHLRLTWLDLGFVWVYLLPLLIGLSLATRSADDKYTQRWRMFDILIAKPSKFIAIRSCVVFFTVFTINLLLLVIATVCFNIPLNSEWVWLVILLFAYQLFWTCCVTAVAQAVNNPHFSVIAFIGIWLLSIFLLPSTKYLVNLDKSHVQTGMDLLISQRQSINNAWDRDKQTDLDTFLEQYSEYKDTAPIIGRFDWKWYYAMQTTSDNAVSNQYNTYSNNIEQANQSTWARILSPSTNFDLMLTRLADTDYQSQQNFEQQIIQWHEQLKSYWYPYLFFDLEYQPAALDNSPEFLYSRNSDKNATQLLSLLMSAVVALVIITFSVRQSRKR